MIRKPLPASLDDAAAALEAGVWTSRALVESCLEAVAESADAQASYLLLDASGARASAERSDAARRAGRHAGVFDGIPISIKDLFDVAGRVTTAGSKALADTPPAEDDAPCLAGLRRAGFIFLGRTHMTEFAYSGLGLNAHFPDPASIWKDCGQRVPGGSSSGAAVSVATRAALAAIGTDTGGSCRIPAAFNGLVGFKPTAQRVAMRGYVPLSPSLDSVGPLAPTVGCCAILDQLLSGEHDRTTNRFERRLLVPTNLMLDKLDTIVAKGFESALHRLEHAGFEIVQRPIGAFGLLPELTDKGGLVAAEAYRHHASSLAVAASSYDERTLKRIRMGEYRSDGEVDTLRQLRARFIAEMRLALEGFSCLVAPTVPVIAPLMTDCLSEPGYTENNILVLRNPSIANLMNGCSISLPIHGVDAPVGLMLSAPAGDDGRLLSMARTVEHLLKQ